MTDKYYLKYDEKNGYPKSFPILNGIIKKEKVWILIDSKIEYF